MDIYYMDIQCIMAMLILILDANIMIKVCNFNHFKITNFSV